MKPITRKMEKMESGGESVQQSEKKGIQATGKILNLYRTAYMKKLRGC